jgi:hypothetical protein
MPRPGPRRPIVALRLSEAGIRHVDERALEEGLTIRGGEPNRSEMARLMLTYAAQHMPKGWRPTGERSPAEPDRVPAPGAS